ncbi:uncharacterized protein LOC131035209 isoform X2 [Cryptomeria japonica]|uniref:uncharacterized protein LOC131035209 isoform X2 n=1 Tax=Cryptomeria japonica TaxID=3369 RepID=UPI0025AD8DFC|nr:uncharacterized protein LOC131035209 isoform X2 [Cryptomeria japonica]
MGIPLNVTEENSSSSSPAYPSSNYENGNDSNNNTNRVGYLFVYGDSRPDAPGSTQNQLGLQNKRAWLLGSRLYSFNTGGNRRAAVKLDESGNAVLGYAIATDNSTGIARLLDEYERREYSPDLYERDVVEAEAIITTAANSSLEKLYQTHLRKKNHTMKSSKQTTKEKRKRCENA